MLFGHSQACKHAQKKGAPALLYSGVSAFVQPGSRQVLCDVTFHVEPGECIALCGHNGAGKSTLLRLAVGIQELGRGKIEVFGYKPRSCAHLISMLPQRSHLDWSFPVTVERFIEAGRYVHQGRPGALGASDRGQMMQVVERFGLGELLERPIGALSGGQQQRILLARLALHDAQLLLLDEPTTGLDQQTRSLLTDLIGEWKQAGKTLLIACHEAQFLENLCDRSFELLAGHLTG